MTLEYAGTSAWAGVATAITSPSAVPQTARLSQTVKLQPTAVVTVPLRDEMEERRRIIQFIDALKAQVQRMGLHLSSTLLEWRQYAADGSTSDVPLTAVVIFASTSASREQRSNVLSDLLDFIAEHKDAAVRQRVSVRVR